MLKSFRKFADVLVRCWKNTTSASLKATKGSVAYSIATYKNRNR